MERYFYTVIAGALFSLGIVSSVAAQVPGPLLYESPGFKVTSGFGGPDNPWCDHVFLTIFVEYDVADDAKEDVFGHDYQLFLQTKIIPKIREICPRFPHKDNYFKQTLRLEFMRIGDSHAIDSIGFRIGSDGSFSMMNNRQPKLRNAGMTHKPENKQEEAGKTSTEAFKIPSRLVGLYGISENGAVLRFDGKNESLDVKIQLPNKLSVDVGEKLNDHFAKAVYESSSGLLKIWQKLIIDKKINSKYRHCGNVYGLVQKFQINRINQTKETFMQGRWEIHPIDKSVCVLPTANSSSCSVVGCNKYADQGKLLLLEDKESAVAIGKAIRSKSKQKGYSEQMGEAKSISNTNKPTYWDQGGDCGATSCYDQTVDGINQFLIDNYW